IAQQAGGGGPRRFAHHGNEGDRRFVFKRNLLAELIENDQASLCPDPESHSRSGWTAAFLDESIVSAAAAQGVLGSKLRADYLESGLGIVVESSDEIRV